MARKKEARVKSEFKGSGQRQTQEIKIKKKKRGKSAGKQ